MVAKSLISGEEGGGEEGEGRDELKNKDTALCLHLRHPELLSFRPHPTLPLYPVPISVRKKAGLSLPSAGHVSS